MMINLLLLIFSLFTIKKFFFLAKNHNRYLFLYSLSGVLFFLISYYLFTLLSLTMFSFAFKNNYFSNELVMSCFTIPFAILITGVYYQFLKKKFKSKKIDINEIGNKKE